MESCGFSTIEISDRDWEREDFKPRLIEIIINTVGDLGCLGNYPLCIKGPEEKGLRYDCCNCSKECKTKAYLEDREGFGVPGVNFIAFGFYHGLPVVGYRLNNGGENYFFERVQDLIDDI